MKQRVFVLGFLLIFPLAAASAQNAEQLAAAVDIQKVDQGTGVTRVFSRLWARLRAYVPTAGLQAAVTQSTQIAGVRGAESTSSQLEPYWKGDQTTRSSYVREIKAFRAAMELADTGELAASVREFNAFAKTYPESSLKPNVQFALGLAYGEMGQNEKSIAALKSFVQAYPAHPLANDAWKMIKQLQKR